MFTEKPQNEQNKPLMYHIKGVAKCVRKWFEKMPLFVSIPLVLLAMYMLFSVVNILLQAVAAQLNCLYTILGIIASAIIIYQFLIEKLKKDK